MLIYLVVFFGSALLFWLAEKTKKKYTRNILVTIAILLPAILAGVRDSSVGTDVMVYGKKNYEVALSASSFKVYFSNYATSFMSEPLYHILVYGLTRIFDDYHWGLFFYQLIPLVVIYLGAKRYQKIFGIKIWLFMVLYYLTLYNVSLNLMRQLIGVAFVFWATSFLFEKRYKEYFIVLVAGFGFHSSAIIGFAFLPMLMLLQEGRKITFTKQCLQGVSFLGILFVVLSVGSKVIEFLVANNILRKNYLNYLSGGSFESYTVSGLTVLIYFIYFMLYSFHYKLLSKRKIQSLFFLFISLIVLIAPFGQLISTYLSRIVYYFIPLQMVSMANILSCYRKDSKKVWIVLILLITVIVWYINYVLRGYNETVPYISMFS